MLHGLCGGPSGLRTGLSLWCPTFQLGNTKDGRVHQERRPALTRRAYTSQLTASETFETTAPCSVARCILGMWRWS